MGGVRDVGSFAETAKYTTKRLGILCGGLSRLTELDKVREQTKTKIIVEEVLYSMAEIAKVPGKSDRAVTPVSPIDRANGNKAVLQKHR